MNKRDAVLAVAQGTGTPGYVPAAFFIHFDPSCHTGQAAVDKHLEFFRFTGMDFVKIQYERTFPRDPSIGSAADWAHVKPLDKAFFEPQLQVVEGLVKAAKSEALVIVTLYSPFMCAGHVGGMANLSAHAAEDLAAVKKGMQVVTDSLMVFVRECIRLGVDGFYHSTQGAEPRRFSDPSLFYECVKPYDLAVMNPINEACPFNILHVCDYHREEYGGYESLEPFLDYPGDVVNCSLEVGGRTLTAREVAQAFGRPFMGGMNRKGALATGPEASVREEARAVLSAAPDAFILGADCTVPGPAWENLRAAIEVAHSGRA